MSDFLWPSDRARAENYELNRVCERLEEVADHLDAIRAAARVPYPSEQCAWVGDYLSQLRSVIDGTPYRLSIAMKFDAHWCRSNPADAALSLQVQSAGMIRARTVNNLLRGIILKADVMVNAAMNEGAGPAMRNAVDAYLEQKGKAQ